MTLTSMCMSWISLVPRLSCGGCHSIRVPVNVARCRRAWPRVHVHYTMCRYTCILCQSSACTSQCCHFCFLFTLQSEIRSLQLQHIRRSPSTKLLADIPTTTRGKCPQPTVLRPRGPNIYENMSGGGALWPSLSEESLSSHYCKPAIELEPAAIARTMTTVKVHSYAINMRKCNIR